MSKNLKHRIVSPNAGQLAVQQIINQAEDLINNKEVDQAITLLESAEQDHPDNPALQLFFGKTLIKEKSALDGIKKLENALAQHPEHLGLLLELGQTHLRPGNTKRATPYIQKALELAPDDPNTHIAMGSLAQRKGDLPLAVENYRKALELQLKHPTTKEEPKKKEDFEIGKAENLLWNTLALMAKNGVHMFPAFGTLLGLERNGSLLLHDKDIDTGIPFSEMNRAINILKQNGWQEVNNSFGYSNPRAFLHTESKISMDISGFVIDAETGKALTAGAWMPGIPKEWNLIFEFDNISLKKTTSPDGKNKIWYLVQPEKWLSQIYGEWTTPDKNFDTMVRGKNIRSFSLLLKCFAYSRIFESLSKNNTPKALALTRSILELSNDGLLKRILKTLEKKRVSKK